MCLTRLRSLRDLTICIDAAGTASASASAIKHVSLQAIWNGAAPMSLKCAPYSACCRPTRELCFAVKPAPIVTGCFAVNTSGRFTSTVVNKYRKR